MGSNERHAALGRAWRSVNTRIFEQSSATLRADGGETDVVPDTLIVASNRQPYRHRLADDTTSQPKIASLEDGNGSTLSISVDEPTGGLTAGLDPVLRSVGGTWIAWGDGNADRVVTDEDDCVAVPPDADDQYTLRRLWLSEEAVDGYYAGLSNRVLWPLCHDRPDLVSFRPTDLAWYRRVNRKFAAAIRTHATPNAGVWIHDYHLSLVPSYLVDELPPGTTLGFFWHIPWPTPDVFESCPFGRELLVGLLGADVLGFHLESYATRFLECVDRFVRSAETDRSERAIRYDGTATKLVASPMGVDTASYERRARAGDRGRWESLCEQYGIDPTCDIGIGVDRLDYTKGIPERLEALEQFFENHPDWRGSFTFVQKATPSRTGIPAYDRLGDRVRRRVERLQARFGTDTWQPVVYTEDILPVADLVALYRRADLAIVSSLCDGMNLVAQEYVASSVDNDGVLLLGTDVGAAEVLGAHALLVDPTDTAQFADQICDALTISNTEVQSRMRAMRQVVTAHRLEAWMGEQLEYLAQNPLESGHRPENHSSDRWHIPDSIDQ
ncbi:trehalose-6-phosphate synthase [Natrialbaceae archaeon A-CW2]|uniref:alpha,alpha-trehalose-phosphate synthase (UDP-forming) n=1 Tax=Natronosalvus amylolyticus TaxID=2961994 RepID=UPI0020CA112D|nr:trehalose-6-phosphate synthase [Natronosalvus amylolyticus]